MAIGLVEEEIFCFWFVTWPHVTTWPEGHVTLWVSTPLYKSPSCQVWWSRALCKRRNSVFRLQVTAHDFGVREPCDIMGKFPLSLVITLQSLVIIDPLEEEILSFQFVKWLHVTTWWASSCGMGEFCSSEILNFSAQVLCQCLLKTHNLPVTTCVNLWPCF